jgi:hypothetical protein
MEIDPTMCMKKQATMTKYTPVYIALYTKMQQFWNNRQQSAGLLAENANQVPSPARLRVPRHENDFRLLSRFGVHKRLRAERPSRGGPDSSRGEERWRCALLVDDAPYLMLGAQVHNSSDWPAIAEGETHG